MMKLPAGIDNNLTMRLLVSLGNSPLAAQYKELAAKGWQFFVVDQVRGRCYYGPKYITIPQWALSEAQNKAKHNYWVWYVAHEMSHAYNPGDHHGARFMNTLKQICPEDCVGYELGYKPQQAMAAGIGFIAATAEKGAKQELANDWMPDL